MNSVIVKKLTSMKYLFLAFVIVVLGYTQSVYAQRNFTLYSMDNTNQANYLNPGFQQKNRFYFSFMGMQNLSLMHTGFKYNDLLETSSTTDSLYLSTSSALEKMGKKNFVNIESYNEMFGLGIKVKQNYFSFNVSNRFEARFTYPEDLFRFAIEGNGKDLLGQRASLDGLGVDMLAYMEYGLGYNRDINDKLTVGGRLKLLSGVANIHTEKSLLGISTDATTFNITIDGAMKINTSNLSQFEDTTYNPLSLVKSAYNFQNFGLAVDLGASYQLTDKIQLSSSLVDLGFIKWKTNVSNYGTDNVNYTFEGIDLNAVIYDSLDIAQSLTDTLGDVFTADETNEAYSTALHAKFNIGGKYKINKYFSGNFLMYNEIYAKKYSAGFSFATTIQLKNWLSASLNYNIYGRAYNNVGFGLSLKGGPIQFYIMSDNIVTFLATTPYTATSGSTIIPVPYNSKKAHVAFGLSVVIGPKKDKDKDGIVDKKDKCPEMAGSEYFKGCPDRDNDSIIDLEDECPDLVGLAIFKGCPDKDKDSVQDRFDDCPEIAGLVKFKGCPDKDNDSIIDGKDDCPDIAGLAKFKGCPDTDTDGIKDSEDECPEVAGTLINQGCPDTDLDGIIDQLDNCPTVVGPKENIGCPWPDTDEDGLLDKDDKCPYIKGPIQNQGCPYEDTDGDGILDQEDQCPSVKGVIENHGCPKIEEAAKEILKTAFDDLEFNTGNAVIKEISYTSLNDLAALLLKKPEWKLQIVGHTDNVGNDQSNLILSKKRAEAIKTYLVSKGVAADRLRTLFFGETQPIASNDTEEGRQKNRRVEMTIVFE